MQGTLQGILSGGNGVGKSTLLGRWVRQLETRLYTAVNLTQAELEAVGINRSRVFDAAAIDLLVRATAGAPRSVCLLARVAWLEAAHADREDITAQTVQQAMEPDPGLPGLAPPRLMVERIRPAHASFCRPAGRHPLPPARNPSRPQAHRAP